MRRSSNIPGDHLSETRSKWRGMSAIAALAVMVSTASVMLLSLVLSGATFMIAATVVMLAAVIVVFIVSRMGDRAISRIEKGIERFNQDRSFRFGADGGTSNLEVSLDGLFDAVEDGERRSRELIRNISHEVRTPLTSLKIVAEGMGDGVFPTTQENLKLIVKDVRRVDETINVVKYYSTLDCAGEQISRCDLSAPFIDAYERAKRIAPEGVSVKMKSRTDAEFSMVTKANPAMLSTLFDSISANAFEHAGGMSVLEFSVSRERRPGLSPQEDMIKISIADDGCGMSHPEKALRPFWKEDESHTSAYRDECRVSVGLGLSIAAKIMESSGGYIDVTSKEGYGTCVSMWFPSVS